MMLSGHKYDLNLFAEHFRQGDETALRYFFEQWYTELCVYSNYYTHDVAASQDIVTEAFLKIWIYRTRLSTTPAIRSYLYTIIKGNSIRWKGRQRQLALLHERSQYELTAESDAFTNMANAELIRFLHKAIFSLPPACSQIFKLLYIEGRKAGEIARLLDISPSTVKAQRARGIRLLREKICWSSFI